MTAGPSPDPPSLEQAFAFLKELTILHQLATAELALVLPEGLHPSHFAIVHHLVTVADSRSPVDLARIFQTTKQNMTNSVLRLSQRGLVAISDHPTDGRSKLVTATPVGRDFHARAVAAIEPFLAEVAAHPGFDEIVAAMPALRSLRAFLDARRN